MIKEQCPSCRKLSDFYADYKLCPFCDYNPKPDRTFRIAMYAVVGLSLAALLYWAL